MHQITCNLKVPCGRCIPCCGCFLLCLWIIDTLEKVSLGTAELSLIRYLYDSYDLGSDSHRYRTGMFGLRECDRFGAPPKRLLGGVEGFYEALGGLLARYFVRAGGLGRPFLFKWGAAAQKIVGCVLSPVWVNPVSSTDSLRQYYAYSH